MLAPILQHAGTRNDAGEPLPMQQKSTVPRNGGHRPKERPVQVPYAIFLNTDRLLVLLEMRSSTAGLRLRPVGGRFRLIHIFLMTGGFVLVRFSCLFFRSPASWCMVSFGFSGSELNFTTMSWDSTGDCPLFRIHKERMKQPLFLLGRHSVGSADDLSTDLSSVNHDTKLRESCGAYGTRGHMQEKVHDNWYFPHLRWDAICRTQTVRLIVGFSTLAYR